MSSCASRTQNRPRFTTIRHHPLPHKVHTPQHAAHTARTLLTSCTTTTRSSALCPKKASGIMPDPTSHSWCHSLIFQPLYIHTQTRHTWPLRETVSVSEEGHPPHLKKYSSQALSVAGRDTRRRVCRRVSRRRVSLRASRGQLPRTRPELPAQRARDIHPGIRPSVQCLHLSLAKGAVIALSQGLMRI